MNEQERDVLHEHLGYSIDLVVGALQELNERPHADHFREWFRIMSAYETFWGQARLLIEFFQWGEEQRGATASRFTDARVNYEFPSRNDLEKQINDQIAHMNYERTVDVQKKLQLHKHLFPVADALKRAIELFEQNLKPEAREVWNNR